MRTGAERADYKVALKASMAQFMNMAPGEAILGGFRHWLGNLPESWQTSLLSTGRPSRLEGLWKV